MSYGYWIVALLLCEIFESWWQHAPTLGEILEKFRHYFHHNLFILFAMHPSFWLVLYLYASHGFKGIILSLIVVMKASDIAFKLWIIQKIDRHTLSADFEAMLTMPLSIWMTWINIIVYPALLAFALG